MKIRGAKTKTKYKSRLTRAELGENYRQDERTSDLPRTQTGELPRRPAPTNIITSIYASSVIISVWVRDEIHGPGFFSSVTEFTHVGRDHPVETLASVVLTTNF